MAVVEVVADCTVNGGDLLAVGGDRTEDGWGGSLVAVFESCHVSTGKWHTIVTFSLMILPLPLWLRPH